MKTHPIFLFRNHNSNKMEKGRTLLAMSTIIVAVILTVSCFDVHWVRFGHEDENTKTTTEMGLWRLCSSTAFTFEGQTKTMGQCHIIDALQIKISTKFWAARIFTVLTVVMSITSAITTCVLTLRFPDKTKGHHISILLFGCGVFGMIAMTIFTDDYVKLHALVSSLNVRFGRSFAFGWAGTISALAIAAFVTIKENCQISQTPFNRFF